MSDAPSPMLTADDVGFTALSRGNREAAALLTGKEIRDLQGPSSIHSAVAAFRHRLDRGDADRLPFGLGRVDRATRGVEPGEFFVFLGRTASLKTMWMLNHIRHIVTKRNDLAVLLVELEMPREQLVRRVLRMEYNRTDDLLDSAIASGAIDLDRFCERYQHLYFVDQGAVTLATIKRYTQDLQRQIDVPLAAVFIDHAGLIRPEHASGSSYERATATAIGLKQLARELGVALGCIVQANRAGNRTDGEPVNLEAARDSGAFEENCDFCLAFSNITEPAGGQPFVKMRLAKNRRGPNVPSTIGFDPLSLKMHERDEMRDGH
jgi:replicative DNA helicase